MTYTVVGAARTGRIHTRVEIRDLQAESPIQFSLFIRALKRLQALDKNKPNSWWQIGGIHGLPYEQWTGDPGGPKSSKSTGYGGYCYHGSALFPTWHRPLLMLLEQAITDEAIDIVTGLEKTDPVAENENWVRAANELRFPFWDWTRWETAGEGIPDVFRSDKVPIVKPGGSFEDVDNPLQHYRYADKFETDDFASGWSRTYRWVPLNEIDDPKTEQYDQSVKAFSEGFTLTFPDGGGVELKPVKWLRRKVSGLFHNPLTLQDPKYNPNLWGYFSNTGARQPGRRVYLPKGVIPSPSLEESHNKVHLDTGGIGTMSIDEYSAFDPIFFLHHCNVDRLYAFWEYLYPDYWIGAGWKDKDGNTIAYKNDGTGNFEQAPNAPINHRTPLIPFRIDAQTYWTSDHTRSLLRNSSTKKYYTYPPIKDPRTKTVVQVDQWYPKEDLKLRAKFQQALLNEWEGAEHAETFQTFSSISHHLTAAPYNLLFEKDAENNISSLRHFVVIGELPEFAFPGSYRLELYLLPKNGQLDHGRVQVINSISVLARANPAKCAACQQRSEAGSHVLGHMALDPLVVAYLISRLDYTELPAITDLDAVTALVKGSFGTRYVKPDGTIIAAADPYTLRSEGNEKLDVAKVPNLTLESHVVKLDHKAKETHGASALPFVSFEDHEEHGTFGSESDWKVF